VTRRDMPGKVARNGTRRLSAPCAGRAAVPLRTVLAGPRSRGSSADVLRAATMRGGWVGPQARPKHARRPDAGRWAGRMAQLRSPGPPADRRAHRRPARRDPLVHPVAITEHCVIGDQIRVPAAWCDMAGCRSRFADPAALGEADNRVRALAAGWGQDAYGRLVCPACQQRLRGHAGRERRVREPETAAARPSPGGPAGPPGGVPPSVRSLLVRWYRAVSRGRLRGMRWLQLLVALATGSNGWTVPHGVTVPDRRPVPPRPRLAWMGLHRRSAAQ